MTAEATYVLPIRCGPEGPPSDLTAYLGWLAERLEVVVVDGSAADIFAAQARCWAPLGIRHVPPSRDLHCANGKVAGVLTGLRLAGADRVVIADDDVRYDGAALERTLALLDDADLVRPQNHFSPVTWHAALDSARSLLNRFLGGDYPGTMAVRRSLLLAAGGYDGDVLFENLELMRTVKAVGGRVATPLDLYVARRPPTTRKFWSQRVRQAYDDFAQPPRLAVALAVVPGLASLVVRSGRSPRARRWLAGAAPGIIAAAEVGRRRAGGRRVFPLSASLVAPVWVVERGVCSWLALLARLCHGGCPYAGGVVRRAANPQRALRQRIETLSSALSEKPQPSYRSASYRGTIAR